MEKKFSEQFFASFVESIQDVCRNYIHFSQFVEVSGYVWVEIDNMKKERYVLSELLQSSGNVVSESYCTKALQSARLVQDTPELNQAAPETMAFQTRHPAQTGHQAAPAPAGQAQLHRGTENSHNNEKRRQSWVEASDGDARPREKMRRPNVVIEICDNDEPQSWSIKNEVPSCQSDFSAMSSQRQNFDERPATSSNYARVNRTSVSQTMSPSATDGRSYSDSGQLNVQRTSTLASNQEYYPDDSMAESGFCSETQQSYFGSPMEGHSYMPQEPDLTANLMMPDTEDLLNFPQESPRDDKQRVKLEVFSSSSSTIDDDEIIDLDLFEDVLEDIQPSYEFQDATSPRSQTDDPAGRKHGTISPGSAQVIKSAVKQFQRFCQEKYDRDINLFSLSHDQLDGVLLDFFQGARKKKGGEFSSRSLKNVQIHLDMYLRDGGYPYSISKDEEFKSSRDFIKSKLEEMGKYVKSQKHVPVDDSDIEQLFRSKQFGVHCPEAIVNSMWFLNSKYFALRRPLDHFNMKWGDISLKASNDGRQYIERKINDSFSLKVFAKPQSPSRCFVNIYKQYFYRRPQETLDMESPFYLSFCRKPTSDVWFVTEQMTWSRMAGMWRKLVSTAGLSANKKIM
ncbi:transcriptional regulator QRICH1-like [Haliotis cracherodii]|uniref:transcriptional regulator QRICH1-like n=1 Tax=Haliotis cracherodii TaxID=6455 RepID=UPI0039E7BCBE